MDNENKKSPSHPIQPAVMAGDVLRFKENKIVSYLLQVGQQHGVGLNELHCMSFSLEDRQQFNQLIGYSLSGYGDLGFPAPHHEDIARAVFKAAKDPKDVQIELLTAQLRAVRLALAPLCSDLFERALEDLLSDDEIKELDGDDAGDPT